MNLVKKVLILFSFIAAPFFSIGQAEKAIEKGNVLLNPSITLGWYDYGYGLDIVNIIPPVAFNFEYATFDNLSFGVEAEYGIRRYRDFNYSLGDNEYKYEYKTLAIRGSFHYLDFLKGFLEDKLGTFNSDKFDFYVGATTGVIITTNTKKWRDDGATLFHEQKSTNTAFKLGYFAGFRYYFSKHFGTFLETGQNSLGWAKVGLTLKF